jgi:hypothetical protein
MRCRVDREHRFHPLAASSSTNSSGEWANDSQLKMTGWATYDE